MRKKVAVGMSGGVDSSVAAYLLQEAGYEVTGIFMELNGNDGLFTSCSVPEDKISAQKACEHLGIDFRCVDFSAEFRRHVVEYFIEEYKGGRTPNPDVVCNAKIKFGELFRSAQAMGAEYFATGHYVRLSYGQRGTVRMKSGLDPTKDQSFFLAMVPSCNLEKVIFPLGEMRKTQVRALAEAVGLETAKRKESMDVCFIGSEGFRDYLSSLLGEAFGDIIDRDSGKVVGRHRGAALYTIGQRRGLAIGSQGSGERWFVCGKDIEKNLIYVCQGAENPALYKRGFSGGEYNLFGGEIFGGLNCEVKYRYAHPGSPARVRMKEGRLWVCFQEPQRAIAPGQSAAIYSGEECLGGVIIEDVF